MNILICGLPNSGKSQFRRWLLKKLREAGIKTEHWDADQFKKVRMPEDENMFEPTPERLAEEPVVWLIEDVRGTVPHKEVVKPGQKGGAWKPLSWYDYILYLIPDWPTYATFWTSRALQWRKMGVGNWMRESGWEDMVDEEVIVRKVQYFLNGRDGWFASDTETLRDKVYSFIRPVYAESQIMWLDFDLDVFAALLRHRLRAE
jgi:hypothetical protein